MGTTDSWWDFDLAAARQRQSDAGACSAAANRNCACRHVGACPRLHSRVRDYSASIEFAYAYGRISAAVDAGRSQCGDIVTHVAERALERAERLTGMRFGNAAVHEAQQRFEMRDRGGDVLHRTVLPLEHRALERVSAARRRGPRRRRRL